MPLKFVVHVYFFITEFKEISERKLCLKFLFIPAILCYTFDNTVRLISNRIHFEPHTHRLTEYPTSNQRNPGFFQSWIIKPERCPCKAIGRSKDLREKGAVFW